MIVGKQSYSGKVSIKFNLTNKKLQELFIDFQGKRIHSLEVNGTHFEGSDILFEQHRILIPSKHLNENSVNTVEIYFDNLCVRNSAGLHQFTDPVDQSMYFYTHLEPFFCHRWFPCFDQPSIRAPLKMSVITAQDDWNVYTNDKLIQKIKISSHIAKSLMAQEGISSIVAANGISNEGYYFTFDECPPISSYIYALAVGPYLEFEDTSGFKVPMKIMARQSKGKLVFAEDKFKLIRESILFFEEFFSTPFPFKKYDQIFVPEFRISGMENVGLVVLRDTFLTPPDEQTYFEAQMWIKVAVHELSHMWFGDLVTMFWWNDLWLKESFADYCTSVCLEECEALSYVSNPRLTVQHYQTEALGDDTRNTTHPISVTVNHTNDAINVFDKICYRKGACFLKQIDYFIGRRFMKEGIKIYFQKYKFQNTLLKDFIDSLQEAINQEHIQIDLQAWVDSWLLKAGVNELTSEVYQNQITKTFSVDVKQSYPQFGDKVFHEQVIDISLYDYDGKETLIENVKLLAEEFTRGVITGLAEAPAGILINSNNKGYCRVVFDVQSSKFFVKNLSMIKDDVNRGNIWRILCDNMKMGLIKGEDLVQCFISHIEAEDEEFTLPIVLQHIQWVLKFKIQTQDSSKKLFEDLYNALFKKLSVSKTASMEVLILSIMIPLLSDSKIDDAIYWTKHQAIPVQNGKEIKLKKPQRYQLLKKIFSSLQVSRDIKNQLLHDEKLTDFSDFDVLEELGCFASLPEDDQKETLWSRYVKGQGFNVKQLEASAKHFFNTQNASQTERFGDAFFRDVEEVFSAQNRDYAANFFAYLSPTFLRRDQDLQRFIELKEKHKGSDNTNFLILISNEIDLFTQIKL